ncbi:hypothetical protein MGLY_20480 [Neomoorella glycerini]|uniref:Uncharacterized protein n=1 Tax=Neomoorella glycerini TaxID=55779 RepID=A0A6I5ZS42_9FIRM|nr:hypothetical protein [Moorella glycerini]QGP92660.1 hypothetical protein MGLY_20480 [Moorella glycerini]
MQNKLGNWLVPLDEEGKKALLREAATERDLINFHDFPGLKDIYATDVAIAVHLYWDTASSLEADALKLIIGRLLRLIGAYAEKFGFALPVIGIVETASERIDIINRWAADQDWHRGDFSLLPVSIEGPETAEGMIFRFLSSAAMVWADIKRLRPLTLEEYLARLEEERRNRSFTSEHGSLLDAIIMAWKGKKPTGAAIIQWLENRLQDVSEQMKGS